MIRRISIFIRAAHLVGVAAVAGVVLTEKDPAPLQAWWVVAGLTGTALLVTEFRLHPRLPRELCGVATLLKLVLIGSISFAPAFGPWLMGAAIAVAAVGAHAPKSWRHRSLF